MVKKGGHNDDDDDDMGFGVSIAIGSNVGV